MIDNQNFACQLKSLYADGRGKSNSPLLYPRTSVSRRQTRPSAGAWRKPFIIRSQVRTHYLLRFVCNILLLPKVVMFEAKATHGPPSTGVVQPTENGRFTGSCPVWPTAWKVQNIKLLNQEPAWRGGFLRFVSWLIFIFNKLALTIPARIAFAAFLFIHHRRFAAQSKERSLRSGAQVADLHGFFNPKYVRANLRMFIAMSSASFASSGVGWFPG
jgi:hypothetical protein